VQAGLQLLDLAAWTFGEHADRAHTDHDLAGWVDDVATSIQPPARLMSTPFSCRSDSGVTGLFAWARIDDQQQRSFVTGYPGRRPGFQDHDDI